MYYYKGDYDKALDYYGRSLAIQEEIGDKHGMGMSLGHIGNMHSDKGDYKKAEEYLEKSLAIQKEIGTKALELLTTTHLYLAYNHLGKQYNEKKIHTLIKEAEFIGKAAATKEKEHGGTMRLRSFVVDADDADVIGDEAIWLNGEVMWMSPNRQSPNRLHLDTVNYH